MENATENVAQTVEDRLNATRAPIADALETAANTVGSHVDAAGGNFDDYARKTAEALGTTAGYLRTHDARQMVRDAEQAARQNPGPALVCAAALGFLVGAFLRR